MKIQKAILFLIPALCYNFITHTQEQFDKQKAISFIENQIETLKIVYKMKDINTENVEDFSQNELYPAILKNYPTNITNAESAAQHKTENLKKVFELFKLDSNFQKCWSEQIQNLEIAHQKLTVDNISDEQAAKIYRQAVTNINPCTTYLLFLTRYKNARDQVLEQIKTQQNS